MKAPLAAIAALRRIRRLPGRGALPGHAGRIAEAVGALAAAGVDAIEVARLVARLNDALVRRLLRWAEADLGPSPTPYAWIVFGSQGRREQTLLTDQDDLLAYADEGEPSRGWFQALAERVNGDLAAAGIPPCPGGHMARNNLASMTAWRRRFDAAVDGPRPHEAEVWFDFRRVGGRLDTAPLEAALARAARAPLLLHLLAKEALAFTPPAPLLLRLSPSRVVDLKVHGLIPIAFLARCYALEAGSRVRSTLERLAAARRAGALAQQHHEALVQAYRALLALRLRLQLRALAEGRAVTNRVALSELAVPERASLLAAFRAIRAWQASAAYHFLAVG